MSASDGFKHSFRVHPAAEMIPRMSDAEIDELAADIKENGLVEPVVLWCDNSAQKESGQHWGLQYCPKYLLDGRARVAALDRLGWSLDDQRCRTKEPQSPIRLLPAWKRQPPESRTVFGQFYCTPVLGAWPWRYLDPWAYVLSVNVRRRHLTQEQRLRVVEGIVRAAPGPDRPRARQAGGRRSQDGVCAPCRRRGFWGDSPHCAERSN
jgi:hypothetical protein